jgi:hypothetical protein
LSATPNLRGLTALLLALVPLLGKSCFHSDLSGLERWPHAATFARVELTLTGLSGMPHVEWQK